MVFSYLCAVSEATGAVTGVWAAVGSGVDSSENSKANDRRERGIMKKGRGVAEG